VWHKTPLTRSLPNVQPKRPRRKPQLKPRPPAQHKKQQTL